MFKIFRALVCFSQTWENKIFFMHEISQTSLKVTYLKREELVILFFISWKYFSLTNWAYFNEFLLDIIKYKTQYIEAL